MRQLKILPVHKWLNHKKRQPLFSSCRSLYFVHKTLLYRLYANRHFQVLPAQQQPLVSYIILQPLVHLT